jgi:phospholipase/carboxylesterase
VSLAYEFNRLQPGLRDRMLYIFPEAPLRAPGIPGGRAWWPIDMDELVAAAAGGRFRDLRERSPRELPEVRSALIRLISEVCERQNLPISRIVLGGFSQGAMLATDVTLHLDESPGALLIFSGTLLTESLWRAAAPRRAGLRVLHSHGTFDPLLPFPAAEWLRELLVDAGADVQFIPFPGMHTITYEAISAAAQLIASVAGASAD